MNKPRSYSDRLIPALALSALVSIGACGSDEKSKTAAPPCPRVAVLAEAQSLTRFTEGSGRDLTDVDFQADLTNVQADCRYVVSEDGNNALIVVAVAPEITALRGPANRTREAAFTYFVSVLRSDRTILNKQAFDLTLAFPGNLSRVLYVDDDPMITVDIPLSGGASGHDYQVFLGLQLTPEQLEYNRRRRATVQ